ncbi:WGR and DUF4132 domain-containing protein [Escherichia coli]|nr:DUF4132 domain-containing protein [Escherichia coli]EHL7947612.1 WGR and DUF4132 domain-containing protein [Escherichia coli]MBA1089629.1 WGR and DUF4132 domain-containing protein [Escherichia coli]
MRHFIYQDEKSHKFRAVEQQGNELHISWGKVGTKGQSQIKSFSDAAAAAKAELKLIAEKVKKGYVEQAKDNSLQPSQTVTGSLKVADLSTIIQEQPSFVAETRAPDKNTDAVLPWLAKDIAVVFPPEVVHTTLSHRRFPGVPVQQADKLPQLRRLACSVSQRDNKTATFDFSACSLEWQNTVAQAISQIDGLKTTQLPSPVMAVLTALEMKCTRYKVREDVMDQIVQEGGLEYATDVIIHLQQIDIEWDYANNVIIILPSGIAPSYLEQYSRFELRLRKHLSLTEESLWQKCAQKLIAAIPHIPEWRQPLIALLLPEKPEIAHEIAQRLLGQKKLPSLEWLKIVATDEHILASLEKYHEPYAIFDDYYCGAIWSATVLQEQGVAALPRFAPYAASDYCADVLRHINHPFALTLLIRVRENARSWLLKYPEHALTGLLPAALGKAGEAQDNARAALRMLTENGHQPLLQEIARRYNQPEVTDAVNALLALDPLDNHPTKIPTLPAFYQPSLWTRPVLKANAQSLPDSALLHLGEMLRFPQEEALYPGLLQVKDVCSADSLAGFAWDLFTAWQTAGAPSKESWAFTALGVLGNDDTARKLTPLIRAWPGESQHKRATVGLDILAAIGSDIALMQLNGIAQKLKFKALQERAKEKIADIAESRELTVAELEDRLAPDLSLDDNGSLLLDFGPRQFTVSFDETLKPFVRDVSGSRLKDLPKPNKSDDESRADEAVNRYKLLKKDARTVAAQQVARLESAMCLRRRWSPENFQLFLVEHPLVRHLTRRLIWGVYSAENQLLACFRVAEDNSYSTADDDLFTMPEGDISIGIPHVLEISPTDAAAFGQLFADYELLPPFRQLDRNSYALTEAERNASELTRWAGRKCPSGRVMGLANKGWIKGTPQDGGWIGWMIKPLGRWSLIMEIDEGFAVGMSPAELSAEQLLSKLWLWEGKAESYGWGSNSTQEAQFSVLDAITASELINDIEALFE